MASYSDKVEWWAPWRCDSFKMTRVSFPGEGRTWNLLVADAAAPAFEVFAGLMRKHDYDFRESVGGTYNCRKIAGSESWSLHAYAIAIDLNPSVNKWNQRTHDYPQGFIDDVLATGLFEWGIDFAKPDPMHWEIDVPPEEIDMPLTQAEKQEIADLAATAVVSRVLTDSSNYLDPPGLGRHVQLIRATVNQNQAKLDAIIKTLATLDGVDEEAITAAIVAELENMAPFDETGLLDAMAQRLAE